MTRLDPRFYQIATLGGLLVYGWLALGFDVEPWTAGLIIATALATQFACERLTGRAGFDPKSALISALSLCLLLRTGVPALAVVAAIVAVGSKFVIRFRGKHVFNPTNGAIVAMLLVSGQVWVSPGQWGSTTIFAFLLAAAGGLVVNRAARADVTWAFLAAHAALHVGRALWLGDPLAIPLHRLQSGALVLFAFFMISDPKTTPDSRRARVIFAILVALGAYVVQFRLFQTNPLLWSLAVCSLLVPVLDRLMPGDRYQWSAPRAPHALERSPLVRTPAVKHVTACVAALLVVALAAPSVLAFCGFYVAKADTKLFNRASQVVLVRHDDKTVITMVNDFKGDPKEFAVVVPVPTVLQKGQIRVGDRALVDRLDAYSAPRLVEYFDGDPCAVPYPQSQSFLNAPVGRAEKMRDQAARGLGVTIEARYTVGEYDILILSARESAGLETWLRDNGYRLPAGVSGVLSSYLKQGMKFFVARVNLAEQQRLGFTYLRPLQMAFESPKFMLPIRLGTVNADGPQELFVYALTRKGRVETTSYRTVRLPTGMELPAYVKEEFPAFYRAMFNEQVKREDMRAVFLEYAWDMGWCDPCAADPLSPAELRKLGVFWLPSGADERARRGAGAEVFITRLHVRYDGAHFPDDLVFQETGDRANFQGRYVLRHPWRGEARCDAAERYRETVRTRRDTEAVTLAGLTGWPLDDIRRRMGPLAMSEPEPWWRKLFGE
jgi:Na+-translocating ferredoxin:NAD+ oxidoreductase RnfD subunit